MTSATSTANGNTSVGFNWLSNDPSAYYVQAQIAVFGDGQLCARATSPYFLPGVSGIAH
jgi:hypothetical protein